MPTDTAKFDTPREVSNANFLLFAVLFLGPLATSAVPLLAPIFFICLSTTIIWTAWRRGMRAQQLLSPVAALTACLLLSGYLFINATWSADPATALRKAGVFASLILMSFAAARAIAVFDDHTLRQAGSLFAAGVFAGGVFILFEVLTYGVINRAAFNHIPFLLSYSSRSIRGGSSVWTWTSSVITSAS